MEVKALPPLVLVKSLNTKDTAAATSFYTVEAKCKVLNW